MEKFDCIRDFNLEDVDIWGVDIDVNEEKPMNKKIIIIVVVSIFIILVVINNIPKININNIEKIRINKLEKIETKTTSLSSEIFEIKNTLSLKEKELKILNKCKKENSQEGRAVDCSIFYNKK